MKSVYEIDRSKINERRNKSRRQLITTFLIVILIFYTISYMRNEPLQGLISATIFLSILIIILLLISFFITPVIYNTRIELTDEQIIRSGTKLLTVQIPVSKVEKIQEKRSGLVVYGKGYNKWQNATDPLSMISQENIIFIPNCIFRYDELKNIIYEKIPN